MVDCSVIIVCSIALGVFGVGCILLITGGIMFAIEADKLTWQQSNCTVLDQYSYTYECTYESCTGTTDDQTCTTEYTTCTDYTTVFNVTWPGAFNSTEWRRHSTSDTEAYLSLDEGDTTTCYYDIQDKLLSLHPGNTEPGFITMMVGSGFAGVAVVFFLGFGALLLVVYLINQRDIAADKKKKQARLAMQSFPPQPTTTKTKTNRPAEPYAQPEPELTDSISSSYYYSSSFEETESMRENAVEEPEAVIVEEPAYTVVELPRKQRGKRRENTETSSMIDSLSLGDVYGEVVVAGDPARKTESDRGDGEVDVEVEREAGAHEEVVETFDDVPVY